jgi:hypothetical protein
MKHGMDFKPRHILPFSYTRQPPSASRGALCSPWRGSGNNSSASNTLINGKFWLYVQTLSLFYWLTSAYTGCSFCRLIRRPEHLTADTGISRQTDGHSFGDHLSSESVSVTPSSVIEASIVLCSVSSWLVWVNVQSACALNTRYNKMLSTCDEYIHFVMK